MVRMLSSARRSLMSTPPRAARSVAIETTRGMEVAAPVRAPRLRDHRPHLRLPGLRVEVTAIGDETTLADVHVEARSGLAALDVTVSLPEVPRSGFTMPKESFLEAGLGLVQRIENRVSGIPTLLDQAREDLEEAELTVADTQQRLGQPFRHAQALANAEEDLARVETELAAMQDEPHPETDSLESERVELTIEAVRGYQPNLGSREGAVTVTVEPFDSRDPTRQPPSSTPSL